jgi:hypothetical protein
MTNFYAFKLLEGSGVDVTTSEAVKEMASSGEDDTTGNPVRRRFSYYTPFSNKKSDNLLIDIDTNKTTSNNKLININTKTKSKSSKNLNPPFQEWISYFGNKYKEYCNATYLASFGKEGKIFQDIFRCYEKIHGFEKAKAIIWDATDIFFRKAEQERWQDKLSVAYFRMRINDITRLLVKETGVPL